LKISPSILEGFLIYPQACIQQKLSPRRLLDNDFRLNIPFQYFNGTSFGIKQRTFINTVKAAKLLIMKEGENKFTGAEAPTIKDFLVVVFIVLLLIVLSWIAYYKLHWLH
jgi:hypothetical protein